MIYFSGANLGPELVEQVQIEEDGFVCKQLSKSSVTGI